MKFEAGEIVKLKSGSIKMTVRESTNDSVTCDWYDGVNYCFKQNTFVPNSLIKCND